MSHPFLKPSDTTDIDVLSAYAPYIDGVTVFHGKTSGLRFRSDRRGDSEPLPETLPVGSFHIDEFKAITDTFMQGAAMSAESNQGFGARLPHFQKALLSCFRPQPGCTFYPIDKYGCAENNGHILRTLCGEKLDIGGDYWL